MPLITIIVPVYNKEKYVAQMIDSIKAQSFRDFECILINDGSTDSSGLICDRLTAGIPLFTVIHIENGGVSHARNIGLARARGNYITFVDSDDEIPPNYLQKITEDIRATAADMVISGIQFASEAKSSSKAVLYPYDERIYTMKELLLGFAEAQKNCGVFGWCWNKTFKRELAESCRFDETLTLYEDFDFYLNVYPYIRTVYFDNKVFYHYMIERSNFSSFKDSEIDYLAQASVNVRYKQFLEKMHAWSDSNTEIVTEAIQRFLFLTIFHSPMECFDERFSKAKTIYKEANIRNTEKHVFKRIILFCIANGQNTIAKTLIRLYRTARRILRKR